MDSVSASQAEKQPQNDATRAWQIFTDENGDAQRKTINITETPFQEIHNEQHNKHVDFSASNGVSNANSYFEKPKYNRNHLGNEPNVSQSLLQPTNNINTRDSVGYKPAKTNITEDTVVFGEDETYTKFNNVDNHEDYDFSKLILIQNLF